MITDFVLLKGCQTQFSLTMITDDISKLPPVELSYVIKDIIKNCEEIIRCKIFSKFSNKTILTILMSDARRDRFYQFVSMTLGKDQANQVFITEILENQISSKIEQLTQMNENYSLNSE